MSDLSNDLELQIAEIKGENAASATQIATEQKAKEEIMEAKVKSHKRKSTHKAYSYNIANESHLYSSKIFFLISDRRLE